MEAGSFISGRDLLLAPDLAFEVLLDQFRALVKSHFGPFVFSERKQEEGSCDWAAPAGLYLLLL